MKTVLESCCWKIGKTAGLWPEGGLEFNTVWTYLQQEAQEAADWLGVEVNGPLTQGVKSADEGSTSGATRKLLVDQREETM